MTMITATIPARNSSVLITVVKIPSGPMRLGLAVPHTVALDLVHTGSANEVELTKKGSARKIKSSRGRNIFSDMYFFILNL